MRKYLIEKITTDLQMVSRPERSVTWTKVSLKEAKMCATPNTSSPSRTWHDTTMFLCRTITVPSSVAEPEPVEPKLFRDLEPEPEINLN